MLTYKLLLGKFWRVVTLVVLSGTEATTNQRASSNKKIPLSILKIKRNLHRQSSKKIWQSEISPLDRYFCDGKTTPLFGQLWPLSKCISCWKIWCSLVTDRWQEYYLEELKGKSFIQKSHDGPVYDNSPFLTFGGKFVDDEALTGDAGVIGNRKCNRLNQRVIRPTLSGLLFKNMVTKK